MNRRPTTNRAGLARRHVPARVSAAGTVLATAATSGTLPRHHGEHNRAKRTTLAAAALMAASMAIALVACLAGASTLHADEAAAEWPLVFRDDFARGADHWLPSDPAAWRIEVADERTVYSQFAPSQYKPPHRSPLNYSLVRDVVVSDFALDVDVRSTCRDYPHRDLCLFFGYQGPAHFYYVHLGKRMDDHANQIFIVNDAPRVKISERTTEGTPWDDEWHHVRIVRRVEAGTIAVYFDDLETPVMTATDRTFTWGQVGLGSFDDTGHFADFELRGVRVERP